MGSTVENHVQVNVTATHVVQCADESSLRTIPSPFNLGPLDHFPFPYTVAPTDVVWVYENPESNATSNLVPIERLRLAISKVLNYYPQLTGRLSIDPSSGLRSITRLGSGVFLLEAICNTALTSFPDENGDLEMYNLPGSGKALIGPWEPTPEGIQRDPLFSIQHTRFQCGSVAIGMRIAHTVCAAEGTLGIYQDLAEIYRSLGGNGDGKTGGVLQKSPHIIPFMTDEMTSMTPKAKAAALANTPPNFSTSPAVNSSPVDIGSLVSSTTPTTASSTSPPSPTPKIVGRTLHFTTADLAALKSAATPPPNSPTTWASTFQALSAYLWQRTHQARLKYLLLSSPSSPNAPPVPETLTLYTSMNLSPASKLALCPPSHSRHFPSAIIPGYSSPLSSSELASAPLWRVAQSVHEWVRSTTAEDGRNLAEWIAAQGDRNKIQHPFPGGRWAFVTAAWDKYALYKGAELGEGIEPVVAGPPFTEISLFDGFATFVEGRGGERGDVEVKFTVEAGVMGMLVGEGGLGFGRGKAGGSREGRQ